MRTRLGAGVLMAMVLAFCLTIAAGDFRDMSMPRGTGMSLSIRSLNELFESIDAAVAASSRDTQSPVREGHILDWAERSLPFFFRDASMDLEVHIFFPPMLQQFAIMGHVVVASGVDFARFREALEARGVRFEPEGEGGHFKLAIPGGPPYIALDAGDGRIVFGVMPAALDGARRALAEGWRPIHWADGVVGLTFDRPDGWLLNAGWLERKLDHVRGWLTADIPTPGLEGADRGVLANLVAAVVDSLPAVRAELAAVERLGFDVRLNGERLGVSLRLASDDGSLVAQAGAAASGRAAVEGDLVDKVDAGAMQLLAMASPADFMPGFEQRLQDWLAGIARKAFPDQHDVFADALRRYFAAGPGMSVTAGFFRDGAMANAAWNAGADPAALADAFADILASMSDMVGVAFPGSGDVIAIADDPSADVRRRSFEWSPDFLKRNWTFSNELVAVINDRSPLDMPMPPTLVQGGGWFAGGGAFMAMTMGASARERLDAALAAGPAASPFAASDVARTAIDDLPYRQIFWILTDYNFITDFFISSGMVQALAGPGAPPMDPASMAAAMEKVGPSLRKTASLVGITAGGGDGCLVLDYLMPMDTVNVLIHNITLMRDAVMAPGMPARIRANEITAITSLKNYVTAQVTFQVAKMGRIARNTGAGERGYADNYRNLFYGQPPRAAEGGAFVPVALITERMANAFAGPTSGAETVPDGNPPAEPAASDGYVFLEPPGLDFTKNYGLVAYPEKYGQSGNRVFFVGVEGVVLEMYLDRREGGLPAMGETPAPLTADETPAANPGLWREATR